MVFGVAKVSGLSIVLEEALGTIDVECHYSECIPTSNSRLVQRELFCMIHTGCRAVLRMGSFTTRCKRLSRASLLASVALRAWCRL